MKIQAAVVHDPGGEIVLEEVQLDEPKANEVLIKMVGTGVCHTDLGVQAQHVKTPLPIALGHEGTGSSKKSVRASRNLNRAITSSSLFRIAVRAKAAWKGIRPLVNGLANRILAAHIWKGRHASKTTKTKRWPPFLANLPWPHTSSPMPTTS